MPADTSPAPRPQRPSATVPPDVEVDVRRRYAAARTGIADGVRTTMLHIGAEHTAVASGSGVEPETMVTLAIGSRKTAADHFRHIPPTALEMENAIVAVEDEVVRARAAGTEGSTLITTDATVREIARLAGIPDQPERTLPLDAMERVFARLAAVTLGRPAAQEGVPGASAFAATLLILREFMHHLKFPAIAIK